MILTKRTMENLLGTAEMAINTAVSDDDVKVPLSEYNWNEQRLQEGLQLHQSAKQKYQQQVKERGDQFQAGAAVEDAYEVANPVYIEHLTLTRLALRKQPEKKDNFALRGRRKKNLFGWIEQAELFYDNVLEDEEVLKQLVRYGLTKEKLEKGRQMVLKVKNANRSQEREKSQSQEATVERNRAFDALSDWLSEFFQVCKFALAANPQVLERIGITAASEDYRRRIAESPVEEVTAVS